jgi:murein DD-endopeptidase MepM/ murein hydrolase activator NlpD
LQKPTDGAQRSAEAPRRPYRASSIARFNKRSVRAARSVQAWFSDHAGSSVGSASASIRAALRPLRTPERALPIAVASIVAGASLLAVLPTASNGAVGSTSGRGQDIRLAVNGGLGRPADDLARIDVAVGGTTIGVDGTTLGGDGTIDGGATSFTPFQIPADVDTAAQAEKATVGPGNFLDDGTLVTGYAPETEVADGSDLIQRYKVKSGDTLVTVAKRFKVSMKTLWWANSLKSKDDLHVGQVLRIPPVSGLVITVTDTDTLDSLSAKYSVKAAKIVELNGLDDPTLVVGQTLVLPGAKGAPLPTPKPTAKPAPKPRSTSSGGGKVTKPSNRGGPSNYNGGQFHWPVVGGGNYVSQYFHSGHGAIDIAGDYGSPIVAAASGRVVFAGWKSNGGGWQVWISHGSGLYTTYNHMSGVAVGTGQSVSRGQRVGRLGASGWATGPHLHFEVWRGGMPWSGGYQTNPMRYF